MKLSQTRKQPRLQDFLTQMKTRVSLIPNPYYETTKKKQKHDTCKIRMQ
jgi:hypothetical protein